MIPVKDGLRVMHITWVLLRHGLDEVVLAIHLFRPIRFAKILSPFFWIDHGKRPPFAVRIRRALEELGPIYVKFGQILSTRRDLLPTDVAEELSHLQDRVPPFPSALSRQLIEKALGNPIDKVFARFDDEPLASASIAQVHTARLLDGEEVVVKVVRPGIERTIRRDVDLMFTIARLAQTYSKEARRLRPVDVVREYEHTIFDELDLLREAANASQLRRNFKDSEVLYVPDVHWELCRKNVMVMERIHGTPVDEVEEHRRRGISMQMLGERGVEIFFTQVFRDNFFHADMHPGNVFVAEDGRYIAIDFGIMGTLTTADQRYLAENLLAFFHRDYRRVAELHVESGWVPAHTRVDEFEAAIRTVSEPIFERPLSEISFGHFLLRLFQTARRFDMEIQPQLVLLQKTLLNIEGLGRQLYPELDLWSTAKPFMERWMGDQVGPRAFIKRIKDGLPELSERLPEVPQLAYTVLRDAARGQLRVESDTQAIEALSEELKREHRRTRQGLGAAALLVSGSLFMTLGSQDLPEPLGLVVGLGLGGVGLLLLLFVLLRR